MVLSTINPRQHDDIRHKNPVFGHGFGWLFECLFDGISSDYGREYHVVGGEHKNTSEMKSKLTWPQLHKTSKIIENVHLSKNLSQFEKRSIFLMEIVRFRVDLRSDNDMPVWRYGREPL